MNNYPVVRHIKTNVLYFYKGNCTYENIITSKEGLVSDEKAAIVFSINLDATEILNKYPLVSKLIKGCELIVDTTK